MPESNEIELCTKEFLQQELHTGTKNLIILDCRSSNEYLLSHIRNSVNFSIPTIILRRLAAGKIDLLSTIKSKDLREKIEINYKINLFVLYNNDFNLQQQHQLDNNINQNYGNNINISLSQQQQQQQQQHNEAATNLINVIHRRLKQDGCRVVFLKDGFTSFRDAFPEWCEDEHNQEINETSRSGTPQADQHLMGLRSLRISTPHSDSACSSSAESSDCESTSAYNQFNEAPVEIITGLFLGNATHSGDSSQLEKYNIKYVLNVTPDLPNVFEATGSIKYLQIPITDHFSQDLAVHFPVAIEFIEEARSKGLAVLVHCLAGVSRSVTVTLAYLMQTRSLCLNEAFNLVRDRKPDVSPNFHFMEQLYSFERKLRHQNNPSQTPTTSSIDNKLISDDSEMSIPPPTSHNNQSKFCPCIVSDCKCMIDSAVEFLASTGTAHQYQHQTHHHHSILKATGVSPDSGIEFDRWTPSTDGGMK